MSIGSNSSDSTDLIDSTDYGPLTSLIGTWQGDKGVDVAPEDDGPETNQYREELIFEPVRDVDNAEEQELVVLRYKQTVIRIRDSKLIHTEAGFYSWDAESSQLIKSFSIPRGVALVAGGSIDNDNDKVSYSVKAAKNDSEWGIVESPFMQQKATTKDYQFSMQVADGQLNYQQSMNLTIYGRDFEHTDENTLTRVGE
ncbi:MAG: heme-binding beta-barrel domain-containing protein [Kangiellaceae bacterium]|nr:heme-binding beta-barrel domain-containing protein [Kangiellaceae bacterium]MCW8999777.1 heme-binding beta-barrel domain-containing protein [Kangiellaceae bacterium]